MRCSPRRFEADAQAAKRVAVGDVLAYVLGVGVVPIRLGVECAADLLDVVVAEEQVLLRGRSRARREFASLTQQSAVRSPGAVTSRTVAGVTRQVLHVHVRFGTVGITLVEPEVMTVSAKGSVLCRFRSRGVRRRGAFAG